MRPFLMIAELTTGQRDPFAVVSIDPTQREGDGCRGIIMSLHMTRDDAEAAIASLSPSTEAARADDQAEAGDGGGRG